MADDLGSIQDDLEQVLLRLESHLDAQGDDPEEMAAVLYSYVMGGRSRDGGRGLQGAIHLHHVRDDTNEATRDRLAAEHGERKGAIVAALREIKFACSMNQPLSRWALEMLTEPSDRYTRKIDHYLGEFGADDLARHRGRGAVNPRLDKMQAALYMIFEWCKEDPENNKLSRKSVHRNVFARAEKMFRIGQADLEAKWRESFYPEILRLHRLRIEHGTDALDEIEGRAPYIDPK
ncbi:MAG: hypothetical protein ACQEXC_05820 [Pseudomonadota bacterium]